MGAGECDRHDVSTIGKTRRGILHQSSPRPTPEGQAAAESSGLKDRGERIMLDIVVVAIASGITLAVVAVALSALS
jgi:hypothetical protein